MHVCDARMSPLVSACRPGTFQHVEGSTSLSNSILAAEGVPASPTAPARAAAAEPHAERAPRITDELPHSSNHWELWTPVWNDRPECISCSIHRKPDPANPMVLQDARYALLIKTHAWQHLPAASCILQLNVLICCCSKASVISRAHSLATNLFDTTQT